MPLIRKVPGGRSVHVLSAVLQLPRQKNLPCHMYNQMWHLPLCVCSWLTSARERKGILYSSPYESVAFIIKVKKQNLGDNCAIAISVRQCLNELLQINYPESKPLVVLRARMFRVCGRAWSGLKNLLQFFLICDIMGFFLIEKNDWGEAALTPYKW